MISERISTIALFVDLIFVATTLGGYEAVVLEPSGFLWSEAFGVSAGQQVGEGTYGGGATGINTHALLWSGTPESYVDLNPSGFSYSYAAGVSAGQQVGWGGGTAAGNNTHALLWSGTPESYVDLNPSGFFLSLADGISGGQQVGGGWLTATGSTTHALLWSGTPESYVDLNPSGFSDSGAVGVSGGQQVGWGSHGGPATGSNMHALLWSGTPESYVDLNPSGFSSSSATGVSAGQQVGWGGAPGSDTHALLWSGTPESYVDLNPSGFLRSAAHGVSGGQQVGVGYGTATGSNNHALLWSGTPESYIDLHTFLPAGYFDSCAYGVDSLGNVVGYACGVDTEFNAVMWVPEPAVPPPPPPPPEQPNIYGLFVGALDIAFPGGPWPEGISGRWDFIADTLCTKLENPDLLGMKEGHVLKSQLLNSQKVDEWDYVPLSEIELHVNGADEVMRPQDQLIFYIGGHGGMGYAGDSLVYTGEMITGSQITEMLRVLGDKEKWVFIDSCYSGGILNQLKELPNIAVFASAEPDREGIMNGIGYSHFGCALVDAFSPREIWTPDNHYHLGADNDLDHKVTFAELDSWLQEYPYPFTGSCEKIFLKR